MIRHLSGLCHPARWLTRLPKSQDISQLRETSDSSCRNQLYSARKINTRENKGQKYFTRELGRLYSPTFYLVGFDSLGIGSVCSLNFTSWASNSQLQVVNFIPQLRGAQATAVVASIKALRKTHSRPRRVMIFITRERAHPPHLQVAGFEILAKLQKNT